MNINPAIKPSLRILLVEDNPGDVIILNEQLKFSGIKFELIHSSTLKDALKQCAENEFDVILLDLGLPESTGLATLKLLPLSALKAPVIVMTGLDDEETALTSVKEGAQDYLVKNNLTAENIIRSIRYSIERKINLELQKRSSRRFSILASATASINESDDIPSIYKVSCDNIKCLLNEQNVFAIEYLDQHTPYTSYFEWIAPYFEDFAQLNDVDIFRINSEIVDHIKDLMLVNYDGKIIEIEDGIYGLLKGIYNPARSREIEKILDINRIYLLGLSKFDKKYGGIFIFTKNLIETEDLSILEVIGSQTSLSIHRRTVEMDLVLSQHRYMILNTKLEERVLDRTKDLARTNSLLEKELAVRNSLEQELIDARDDLEIRVQERTAALAESEARFHNMFYNHEAVMWLVNPESGVIIEANKSAEQFYGHSFNASKQFKVQDLNMHPKEEIGKLMTLAVNQKRNYFIFPHKLASGEIRTVEIYSSPIKVNDETLLFSIIHDITERKQIEEALKESESQYKALVDNSLSIILISVESRIEFANEAVSEFSLIPNDEIIGKGIDDLFKMSVNELDGGNQVSHIIFEAAHNNRAVEIQVRHPLGGFRYFLVRSSLIQFKGKKAVMSIMTDMTENKNVEQFVLNKIIETEENDRKRFAADLHDDLGPILSTIKLRIGLMEKIKDPGELNENISISNELMSLVVEKVRTISHNIAPHIIENLGLDSAIRDLCQRIRQINNINVEYNSGLVNMRFPQSVELHFYRIISELINNSLKHSEAGLIHINLSCKDDTLKLIYYDDGKGYNVQELYQKPGGIGLHSILNRVTLINGTINFQQDKGKTVVKISKKLDAVTTE